jgi:organic radical activating enzyme
VSTFIFSIEKITDTICIKYIVKPTLNYAEVYITNVCNYSCTHCQSLNNFAFKGHQLWKDYQEEYKILSDRVDFERLQIIGGEPTLNPDFEKWVNGISNLWPNASLEISSNGSRLDKITPDIYQILSKNNGVLWLTCHDITLYNILLDFANQFLDDVVSDIIPDIHSAQNWKITYNTIRDSSWPDCDQIEQFDQLPKHIKTQFTEIHRRNPELHLKTVPRVLTDKNGVKVKIDWAQTFVSSAIKVIDNKQMKMKYNNDPVTAHENCYFKTCHQINKGKLYKCPLVSVLPDFLNQFAVDITDADRIVANTYIPLSGADDDNTIINFVENINQPISQCKFCPIKHDKHNFVGTDKKIKIVSLP